MGARSTIGALVCALAGCSGTLAAQTEPPPKWQVRPTKPLAGLSALRISIEDLSEDASRCNVSSEALERAAARAILDSNLKVVTTTVGPMVYVNATVLRTGGACAGSLQVDLRDFTLFTPSYNQPRDWNPVAWMMPAGLSARADLANGALAANLAMGTVSLLHNGMLFTGPSNDFGDRMLDSLHRIVKDFMTDVRVANQP